MRKPLFRFEKIGLSTTFQDMGRMHFQSIGIPESGAMDKFALQVGNILVGNMRSEAAIEIIMGGVEITVLFSHVISITGGDLGAKINCKEAPLWKSFKVEKGDTLTFAGPRQGMIAYICATGGFDIKEELGSKSSYSRALLGEAPLEGEIVHAFIDTDKTFRLGLNRKDIPRYGLKEECIDVVIGPDALKFSEESLYRFFNEIYIVRQISRMGIRLEGKNHLLYKEESDIVSSGVPLGAVQVPANGQPIVLMADRQTTGGYGLIAIVASKDISKLAQTSPGSIIKFREISIEDAQSGIVEVERLLTLLEKEVTGIKK